MGVAFIRSQIKASSHKSMVTIAKLHKLCFELLLESTYSPECGASDFYLRILKTCSREKDQYDDVSISCEARLSFIQERTQAFILFLYPTPLVYMIC